MRYPGNSCEVVTIMVSTRVGMARPPCVPIRCIPIVTRPSGPLSQKFLLCSGLYLSVVAGRETLDAHPVLRPRRRADSPGLVQSLGRPRLASAGAAACRNAFGFLRAARGALLPGEGRRTGPRTKHFRARL